MALPKALKDTAHLLRQLPQIGPRQATRLALFLFRNDTLRTQIGTQLNTLRERAALCDICFRIAEENPCALCRNKARDTSVLAVVEEDTDLEQIETTGAFQGRYFVLGGRFNPNRGTAEEQGLRIAELKDRLTNQGKTLR